MDLKSSKTKLVLIELIIIILFFSIASAFCVNIFVQARLLSQKSTDTTMAALTAQEAVEVIRGTDGQVQLLAERYTPVGDNDFVAYYGADWSDSGQAQAVYAMTIQTREEDGMLLADIAVSKAGTQLFAVTTKRCIGVVGV